MGGSVQSPSAGEASAAETGARLFEEGRAYGDGIRRDGAYLRVHEGSFQFHDETEIQRRDSLQQPRGGIGSVQRLGVQRPVFGLRGRGRMKDEEEEEDEIEV